MDNKEKITTFSSILLLILKELRLERNIHQAQIAEICGKTPSAWTKIETGKSPLTMEVFFKVCSRLTVNSSFVLATMERYASLFSQNNWCILSMELDFNEDFLLQEAQKYYLSAGYRARTSPVHWNREVSILNEPIHSQNGTIFLNPVFQFTLDKVFKESQLNYHPDECVTI